LGKNEEEFQLMMSRAFRPTAATLSILLLTGVPTHAAPVAISEVIQVMGSYQNPPELRLRSISQSASAAVEGEGPSPVASAAQESAAGDVVEIADGSTVDVSSGNTLLSGVAVNMEPQAGVDVVDQGEVEGTICDCGEITVPGGGFPKWPLLFLAAIPFFFIHGCDDCEIPPPTTTPTPPDEVIPEPASLLLFGTGLAAFGARLRKRRSKAAPQIQTTEEG
jgi:PEP-CTERM motif-containing protein